LIPSAVTLKVVFPAGVETDVVMINVAVKFPFFVVTLLGLITQVAPFGTPITFGIMKAPYVVPVNVRM